jgi:hypothetical protein
MTSSFRLLHSIPAIHLPQFLGRRRRDDPLWLAASRPRNVVAQPASGAIQLCFLPQRRIFFHASRGRRSATNL